MPPSRKYQVLATYSMLSVETLHSQEGPCTLLRDAHPHHEENHSTAETLHSTGDDIYPALP